MSFYRSFFTFLLLFNIFHENLYSMAEPILRTCEPIRVEMCRGLGYNMTGMPNLGGNDIQIEAEYNLKSFSPLISYGCSNQLKLFLCSVYVPMCTDKVANPIGPCRGLCESVKYRCFPVLQGFGFPWPETLNCSRFPIENNHEHMCMEGPKDRVDDTRAPIDPAILGRKYVECAQSGGSGCIGSSGGSGGGSGTSVGNGGTGIINNGATFAECHFGNGLYDQTDRKIAVVWITVWALFTLVASLAAALTLMLGGGRVRAPPLTSLALCYILIAAGWLLSVFVGKAGSSCPKPDPLRTNNVDDLPNVICAFVFLLLYYFGMAANVWWVCLCAWWLTKVGLCWSNGKMRSLSSALHVFAWGLPAVQTVAALVKRDVDADELTGTCYIGNKNLQTLLYLVLLPHVFYFLIGVTFLISGWIIIVRKPKLLPTVINSDQSVPLTPVPAPTAVPTLGTASSITPRKQQDLIGTLATLYAIPMISVMITFYVEYKNRSKWISGDEEKPALWFFLLLRHLMSLFVGGSSIAWTWSKKSAQVWKVALKRIGPRKTHHNKNPAPVLRYQQPPSAHHSLIVPGNLNSMSRQNIRIHSHRKVTRSHHLRSGSETII